MVKELHDRYLTGVTWSIRQRWLAWAVVSAGAALRIRLFLLNYSISLDEAAIARNLVDRRWWQLLGPIDYAQVAPPGFLLLEKAAVAAVGSGELVLRAAPLAAALIALLIARCLVMRVFPAVTGLCALALIAFCPPIVEYAAIAKQYAFDVATSLAIVWLTAMALDPETTPRRRWLIVAAMATFPLFSFTAIFVLPAAAIAMWSARRHVSGAPIVIPVTVIGIAAAGAVIGRLSVSAADREYLNWFWMDGFLPLTPRTTREWLWLWRQVAGVFGQTAHYRGATLWLAFSFGGAWWLWRRGRRELAIACGVPLLMTLAASAARMYPFGPGRVHLFLMPLLLLLVACGSEAIARLMPKIRAEWIAAAVVVITTITGRPWSIPPLMADVRTFAGQVAERRAPGDRVYIYYWNAQPFLYYAPRYGLTSSEYRVGHCSMGSGRAYLDELETFVGTPRLWVAMPHSSNVERDTLLAYLDANGRRIDTMGEFGYLYDLSPSPGRPRLTAAAFPLPPELAAAEPFHLTCYGVFVPLSDHDPVSR
jgi:hypothetical protein